jgi:DNA-binding NarL/FixJ family response regulator
METIESGNTIRLLIADDHLFYREGIRALLVPLPMLVIVGEAASGEEAISQAEQMQPDVVLMDIKMPGINGIDAARRIIETRPAIKILMVTMFDDDESVFAAMRAGARGYILKDADREELVRAINAVYGGEAIFSPAIAARMMSYFAGLPRQGVTLPVQSIPPRAFPDLTNREREILHLIAQGHNNTAIVAYLHISLKTVQNHVASILSKLQVASRAQAIIRARDAGLGESR